jgi:octaprenyl-diphosphate synthase
MTDDNHNSSASVGLIRAPIQSELELLEQELRRIFTPDIDLVSAIGQHLIGVKGKRIRPMLVLLAARLGAPDVSSAVKVASAVEIIHTATLLHDDSIDRSHLRRGLPTVNRLWNDQVSVIMGDYLFCTAFRMVHEAGLFEVAAVLSRDSDRTTLGEMFQMDLRGRLDVSEETYLRMIGHKTAALFASACETGAMVGGLNQGERRKLAGYGECLGLAFQVIDDVLDFVGEVDLMGKPVGNDLRDGRVTLPVIVALRNAGQAEAASVRHLVSSGLPGDVEWSQVLSLIDKNGGLSYSRGRARDLVAKAKSCISDLEPTAAKVSLLALADEVVSRVE